TPSPPPARVPLHSLHLTAPATPHTYTLSLHDALPISVPLATYVQAVQLQSIANLHVTQDDLVRAFAHMVIPRETLAQLGPAVNRSEEHTSELQSRFDLVCRLLLEKKKNNE